jgi:hypothetical protein
LAGETAAGIGSAWISSASPLAAKQAQTKDQSNAANLRRDELRRIVGILALRCERLAADRH